jgi:Arc/MetJ-type ribon-helix-helix transcriptional regulator
VRLSVNLPRSMVDNLRARASKLSYSVTEIIHQAIRYWKFVEDAKDRNATFIVKEKDGTTKEVVFL